MATVKGAPIQQDVAARVVAQAPAAIVATDLDGTITSWNEHAQRLYGWTRHEALGRKVGELLVPEAAPTAREMPAMLESGQTWEGETQLRRKDGTTILSHVATAPITNEEGAAVGTVLVSFDVTARIRSARRLAARTGVTRALAEPATVAEMIRKLLRTVCESLGWEVGAFWMVDPAGERLRCLHVWADPSIDPAGFEEVIQGLSLRPGEGLAGRVWSQQGPAWLPDVVEEVAVPQAPAAAELGLHAWFGFPVVIQDQFLGVMEFFSRQVESPDEGLLEAMGVIGSQIGQFLERKHAERAAVRSEAVRSAVLQAALDGVITMDHEGRIVDFNPAAEEIFGYARDEAVGSVMADLIIPPALRDAHWRGLATYLETGEGPILGKRIELPAMRADGSEFPAELAVIRVARTDPPLFTGYVRDITERKQAEDALRASRDQLQAIFQGVAEGITVQNATGQFAFANEAAAQALGFDSAEELLRTPVAQVRERFEVWDEDGSPFPFDQLPGRLALQGLPAPARIVRFRDGATGEERWAQIKASAVHGENGPVRLAVNIFHDITEQHRAEDTQRFVAEASAVLASSLDYDETLRQLARLAVPRLADWCAISVREDDGSIRQVAVEHVDPEKVAFALELGRRYPPDPHAPRGVPEVIRTARSELYPEIPESILEGSARDEEHLAILKSLGFRSAMAVPLVARNRSFGAVVFVSSESGRRYGPEDLRLAEDLAQRAALAVDNARLFKERSAVADALQKSLLPPQLPTIPRTEVAARYYAAGQGNEVGGDFYDAFPTGERSWALMIGDVCGKGPEAAAVTGLARHTIRAAAIQEPRPSKVLATLNDAVIQQRSDHIFCTVCYLRLKVTTERVRATICCAGHPLPLLLRADGRVETAGAAGTLLGIFPDPTLADRVVDLSPGDALVLYTDGVIEEESEQGRFGRDRLVALLESCAGRGAQDIADSIEHAVLSFRPTPPRDDMAILVLRITP